MPPRIAKSFILPFFLLSLALLPFFRYHSNPDAAAYLRIAAYYQHGELTQAVNGVWSPLICWLLVPFYAIGLPWMLAFRLLNTLIACGSLYVFGRIIDNFFTDLSRLARNCLLVGAASQFLIIHFDLITPDLLALFLVLCLLHELLAGNFYTHPLRTGLLGACMYLAKAYCFYFFLGVIGIYTLFYWAKRGWGLKELPFKALFLMGAIFILVSGLWVAALHHKYGAWELSSAPAYNYGVLDANGGVHHPYDVTPRLLPLPYPEAYCLWEDPQAVFHLSGSIRDKHLLSVVGSNLKRLYKMGWYFYIGSLLLLPFLIYGIIRNNKASPGWFSRRYTMVIGYSCLYISGYLLIFVEGRYVWMVLFTLLLVLYKCIDQVRAWWTSRIARLLPLFLTAFLLLTDVYFIATHLFVEKQENADIGQLAEAIPPGSHFATWKTMDLWSPGYLYDWHHYGGLQSYADWNALQPDLRTYQVNYIIIKEPGFLQQMPQDIVAHMVLLKTAGDIRLYSIRW